MLHLPHANLSFENTVFIGRTRELLELQTLLEPASSTRLVNLTGPGGSGKTRLAIEVAKAVAPKFKDNAYYVSASNVRFSGLLISNIANVLGVKESAGKSLAESLKDFLHQHELLLLLDNIEHGLVIRPTLEELLNTAPNLKVLATGFKRLRLSLEKEFPVQPLSLPDSNNPISLEQLNENEAVKLFVNWVQTSQPEFTVTNTNAQAVAELVNQLDGMPLAIELTAARSNFMSTHSKLSELNEQLSNLIGTIGKASSHQQTIENSIQFSYDLLDVANKQLFRRLAIFAGSFNAASVQAVCSINHDQKQPNLSFLEKIQLIKIRTAQTGSNPTVAYLMLDPLRAFGLAELAKAGEMAIVQAQHNQYFLRFCEEFASKLTTPDQKTALEALNDEYENIRTVLDWALEQQASETAFRLINTLGSFWIIRGYFGEGRSYVERVLELAIPASASFSPSLYAKALFDLGSLAEAQGDYQASKDNLSKSLTIYRENGDNHGIVSTLNRLGGTAARLGDYLIAREYYLESLSLCAETEKHTIATLLNNLGMIETVYFSDSLKALAYFKQALAIYQELGNRQSISMALNNIGAIALSIPDCQQAKDYFGQALIMQRELGDKRSIASTLINIGSVSYELKEYEAAEAYLQESLLLSQEIGDRANISAALISLGNLALLQADFPQAFNRLHTALELSEALNSKPLAIETLMVLIEVLTEYPGGQVAAVRLLGALNRAMEEFDYKLGLFTIKVYEASLDKLHSLLKTVTFETAWAEGRHMVWEEAVNYALHRSSGYYT
jgi:predicted ATPase/Tfp pilus assembly protein PilF